jgi:hypothetical protein
MQPQMPRYWVGPCAGVEWLLRFFPLWCRWVLLLLLLLLPWQRILLYGVDA